MPFSNTLNTRSVLIADEASLLSARDTATLLESAQKADARVVLVGDVKQLGSVEAGAAFAQLQGAGMETAKLAEIVRQTNPLTKEAVEASIQGDARRALDALERSGGKGIAYADPARWPMIMPPFPPKTSATLSSLIHHAPAATRSMPKSGRS